MSSLHRMTRFARLVLVWFVLSVGIAAAAPALQPQSLQMVCSGGVMKLVSLGDEGPATALPTLDCPLCAPFQAPPPARQPSLRSADPAPPDAVHASVPAALLRAAPAPARGPPMATRLS